MAGKKTTLVRTVLAEDNILTRAAREKLYGALSREISHAIFATFVAEELPSVSLTEEALRSVLEENLRATQLVDFAFSDSVSSDSSALLLSPLRGLLSVVMLLAGMAATMYFKHDEKEQVYSLLPVPRRTLVLFAVNLAALSVTAVFVTAALLLAGVYTTFWWETVCMLSFVLASAGFCSMLGTLCPGNAAMGVALPLVVVLTMAFCPVFVNVKSMRALQIFLPPYYYLYGIGDGRYLLQSLIFSAITCTGTWFLYPVLCRRRNL